MTPNDRWEPEHSKQDAKERSSREAEHRRRKRAEAARRKSASRGRGVGWVVALGVVLLGCAALGLGVAFLSRDLTGSGASSTSGESAGVTPAETTSRARPAPHPRSTPTTASTPASPAQSPTPVTLTPPAGGVIALGSAKYIAGEAQKTVEVRAGWVERGNLRLLSEPAVVGLISRDKDFCRVAWDGQEWYVKSDLVPPTDHQKR